MYKRVIIDDIKHIYHDFEGKVDDLMDKNSSEIRIKLSNDQLVFVKKDSLKLVEEDVMNATVHVITVCIQDPH